MSAEISTEPTFLDNEKSAYVANSDRDVVVMTVGNDKESKEHAIDIVNAEHEFTDEQYNKLLWKIDLILLPLLMFTYGIQYSDKVSLASGVVFGLKTDTNLQGSEYGLLSVWFYLAYCVSQLPMAWVMQRLHLGRTLSICIIVWGGVVMCMAACNNYAQLAVVRAILGWFEAVITPAFIFIVASWYKRAESTSRQMLYYAMNAGFSLVFGVIIYFIALAQQQKGGLAAWRVINLFLGGLTVFDGFLLLIFMGTPEQVWWLSPTEKRAARARIVSNATGGGESHPWKNEQIWECFRDRQYWHNMINSVTTQTANGAIGVFSTLVFQSFGFSSLDSILYSLPAAAIGVIAILLAAWAVTRNSAARFPIVIAAMLLMVFIFLFVGLSPDSMNKWAKWTVFTFWWICTIPTFIAWTLIPINVAGRTKKSFVAGSNLIVYCGGNITGALMFVPSDAPKYLHGMTACAVVYCVAVVNAVLWWWYYVSENKKREAQFLASGMTMEEREYLNKVAGETDQTDRQNPHFRYAC